MDELIQDHQHDMQNFLIEYYHGDEPNEHESFGPLYEEFLYRKATIAHLHSLQKVEAELEKCRRDAFEPYDVTCARCGAVGSCMEFIAEEGDEWECRTCNERENERERNAAISAGEGKE